MESEPEHEKVDEEGWYQHSPSLGWKYGATDMLDLRVDAHVTENDSATASTHASVLAPSGSATHVPPPAAHASSQLWPSAPSCQMMPVAPHAQSPPGR